MVWMMICPELLNQHRDVLRLLEHLDLLLHGRSHQSHSGATDLKLNKENKKEEETVSLLSSFPHLGHAYGAEMSAASRGNIVC